MVGSLDVTGSLRSLMGFTDADTVTVVRDSMYNLLALRWSLSVNRKVNCQIIVSTRASPVPTRMVWF